MSTAVVATCNLNQWALDFDGNLSRVLASIREAKRKGARFRTGPELELAGYGCEDHFLERDTELHSWESLVEILKSDATDDMLVDIGMPVLHKGVLYNCRVFICNRQIVLIRPKSCMADDGNYRETRWFTKWSRGAILEDYQVPGSVAELTKTVAVPFGYGIVQCRDTAISCETCEELFVPQSPHIQLGLEGVEIFANGSGSHHQLRKLDQRLKLILSATAKVGGVYLYANQRGCDGNRLYYDGSSLVALNGEVITQGSQFSLQDVEVVTAAVNLEEVRSARLGFQSRASQAAATTHIPRVKVDFAVCCSAAESKMGLTRPLGSPTIHDPMEEIAFGPACWLWDYLRRSGGAGGFFIPLSGGADSSSVLAICRSMCVLVAKALPTDATVRADLKRITRAEGCETWGAEQIADALIHTCYMGTENSSVSTQTFAKTIAGEVGAYHLDTKIDSIVAGFLTVFKTITGKTPSYLSRGGTHTEDLALQNIQARCRMVLAYLLAQLLPWHRGRHGFLLVLSTGNVDEALRGYLTKYDCSSGDLNPIGSVSKVDLKAFLHWAAANLNMPTLSAIVKAPPTAELRPIDNADGSKNVSSQTDEDDMGMTYEELSLFGRARKIHHCGPMSMFRRLCETWSHLSPTAVAKKVQHFFSMYGRNRHKMTTITPSYHAESYSPDDNRFDHRPFLYPSWDRQFQEMDKEAESCVGRSQSSRKRSRTDTN